MRRSLPLLALLLATTAACSQAGNDPPRPRRSRPSRTAQCVRLRIRRRSRPSCPRRAAGRAARPARMSARTWRPASPSTIAIPSASRPTGVAEMQQEHAAALRPATAARCRITGMDYRAANEDDVEAMLSFLVDPAIAGQFGRESVRAVNAADGELTESEVSGTDVGTALKTNAGNLEELRAELARIEARLAARGLRWRERASLEDQRQSLRQQIADLRATAGAQEQALATTPMLFRYGSGALAPGPARAATVREATAARGRQFPRRPARRADRLRDDLALGADRLPASGPASASSAAAVPARSATPEA